MVSSSIKPADGWQKVGGSILAFVALWVIVVLAVAYVASAWQTGLFLAGLIW